jgi:hypothetical protein
VTDPFEKILELNAKLTRFPANSRYYGLDTRTLPGQEGRTVIYLSRRFLPPPDRFVVIEEHTVSEGERLDTIAAQCLGDPELFWRICDANAVMHPDELSGTPGKKVRITLPEGMTGARYG